MATLIHIVLQRTVRVDLLPEEPVWWCVTLLAAVAYDACVGWMAWKVFV